MNMEMNMEMNAMIFTDRKTNIKYSIKPTGKRIIISIISPNGKINADSRDMLKNPTTFKLYYSSMEHIDRSLVCFNQEAEYRSLLVSCIKYVNMTYPVDEVFLDQFNIDHVQFSNKNYGIEFGCMNLKFQRQQVFYKDSNIFIRMNSDGKCFSTKDGKYDRYVAKTFASNDIIVKDGVEFNVIDIKDKLQSMISIITPRVLYLPPVII